MRIGQFEESFFDRDLNKKYYKKGEKLLNWVFPENFVGSKAELYAIFGLWDNENGIATIGKIKTPFKNNDENTWYFQQRIFIGDKSVIPIKGVNQWVYWIGFNQWYDAVSELYIVNNIEFSLYPPTTSLDEGYDFNNLFSNKLITIMDSLKNLVNGITVVGATTPDGTVTSESPQWLVNKQNLIAEIENLKTELEGLKC